MDLAGQVPQSDIDGGDGVEHEAAGLAAHAHLVVHGVPERFNLQASAAEFFSFERRFQNGMNDSAGDFGGGESLRFAPARQAGIRGDAPSKVSRRSAPLQSCGIRMMSASRETISCRSSTPGFSTWRGRVGNG